MDNHEKDFLPHSYLPNDVLKEIYQFWIKVQIKCSTDKRSGRNEIYIIKIN